MTLSVVFILATLLGFASHAPGSLGVFDAAMLVGLPMLGKEELLASLLVFRILYFLIPFAISITILGIRELWLSVILPWQQSRKLQPAPLSRNRRNNSRLRSRPRSNPAHKDVACGVPERILGFGRHDPPKCGAVWR